MFPDTYEWEYFLLLELHCRELTVLFGEQGLRTAWALNSPVSTAVTDAFTSLFASVTPAWQMGWCEHFSNCNEIKINLIPQERFCLQRLLNIIIHFVALKSWKNDIHHLPGERKKVQQKVPMVNVYSCREAERTSFWSAKLFWEQVLLLNRPHCSAL